MNVQETSTGVAQLLRSLPFRELVTFADAMRACADRGADALTCAEAIDAWAHGDTDQIDQKYEESGDVDGGDDDGDRERDPQGGRGGDRGAAGDEAGDAPGASALAHGQRCHEPPRGRAGGDRGARPVDRGVDDVDRTSAAADDGVAADTSSGADSSEGQRHDDRDARHKSASLDASPAGDDEEQEQAPAGASSEHANQVRKPCEIGAGSPDAAGEGPDSRQHPEQNDGGPGTGFQPPSAAGDADDTSPAAPDASDMTERQRAVLDAIIALQDAGERATTATIGARSGVKQSGVSWYVRWLEERGWIRREGTAGDRWYTIFHRPDGATPPRPPQTPGPQPGTRGVAWSDEEDRKLREMWRAGDSAHAIAQRIERNVKSVYKRAEHLGLPGRKVSTTRRPYQQPVKSQKQREADNKGLCAACQSEPAAENSDLCDGCNAKARAVPGVGEGPLPHYDERKRQEAAEDARRRHGKAGAR